MAEESSSPTDPSSADEGLRFLEFQSDALGTTGRVLVHVPGDPDSTDTQLPMIVLLDGNPDDLPWGWIDRGKAHVVSTLLAEVGEIRPMALVVPDDPAFGDRAAYTTRGARDVEAWLLDEVVGIVRGRFACLGDESPVFLCGFGVGGFGALRLGARHARRVRGVSAHAPLPYLDRQLGTASEPELSILYWMNLHRRELPAIRFDCGNLDRRLSENRRFHEALDEFSIIHRFDIAGGAHDWDFAHLQFAETLRFFDGILDE